MTRLTWDHIREYEMGIDRCVFYPRVGAGEPWNGLVSVVESPSGFQNDPFYLDGVISNRKNTRGEFSGNLSAISYPDSFYDQVLVSRRASLFGLCYRTMTSNSYKLHLVYNVLLAPSAYVHQQQDTDSYSWDFTSLAVDVPSAWYGASKTSHLILEADIAYPETLSAIEDVLYGTDTTSARLPLPDEVMGIFETTSVLQIIDNGDGTWTAIGPDSAIIMLDAITFQITWPSAVYIDANKYSIHSL